MAIEERSFADLVRLARLAEERGYELLVVPEAWGRDAFVTLGAIAANTSRIRLGTAVVNVYSRSPALLGMAAATLDEISGGRAVLGLGVSGRAVIEGWHGTTMDQPLARLREVTEAVRVVVRRDRRGMKGHVVTIAPAFRLSFHPPRERIPIWHASLTPAGLRLCGEIAEGWLPYLASVGSLAADLAIVAKSLGAAGRDRADLTVAPIVPALVADDPDEAARLLRRHVAFYIGGMGRFYRETMTRHGHGETVERVKAEWEAGRRDGAANAVTDALLDAVTVRGSAERCRARVAEFRAAGADLPVIALPAGASVEQAERTIQALGVLA